MHQKASEMKKALESNLNRADHMEERINELKHENLEATQVEEKVRKYISQKYSFLNDS